MQSLVAHTDLWRRSSTFVAQNSLRRRRRSAQILRSQRVWQQYLALALLRRCCIRRSVQGARRRSRVSLPSSSPCDVPPKSAPNTTVFVPFALAWLPPPPLRPTNQPSERRSSRRHACCVRLFTSATRPPLTVLVRATSERF